MLINESQVIDDITKSVGVISNRTLVEKHPYTNNIKEEIDRIEAERKREEQNNEINSKKDKSNEENLTNNDILNKEDKKSLNDV